METTTQEPNMTMMKTATDIATRQNKAQVGDRVHHLRHTITGRVERDPNRDPMRVVKAGPKQLTLMIESGPLEGDLIRWGADCRGLDVEVRS